MITVEPQIFHYTLDLKMPKIRVLKSHKIKDIPTKNPYKYAESMDPIYDAHKISRTEMVELSCHSTHCIKARSTKVPENDNLYELFRRFTDKRIGFVRQWLKLFAITNQRNLDKRGRRYLASKGLEFSNWTSSITEGMKGDIFVLYTLCMLFDKHAVVHLRGGLIWTTLASPSNDHKADLQKCELHLCYIGRGLFIKLVERETPLKITEETNTVQSLIIGKLSISEEKTYKLIESTGLGVAKSLASTTSMASTSKSTCPSQTTLQQTTTELTKSIKIVLVKLNLDPGVRIPVSDYLSMSLPTSN